MKSHGPADVDGLAPAIDALVQKHKIPTPRIKRYTALARVALQELPNHVLLRQQVRNGEGVFRDEAELQKRIISYRLTRHLLPACIVEAHPGKGIGTTIYRHAAPEARLMTIEQYVDDGPVLPVPGRYRPVR
jgi:hypothetical protein